VSAQEFGEPWHYSILNGLPSTTIYEFYKDSKGMIWFGTENGVVCFNGQSFKVYNHEQGLADDVVIRIREDRYGRIWFHHQNKLPSYFRDGKIQQLKVAHKNITIEANSRIVEDGKGVLWLGGKGCYLNILPNDSVLIKSRLNGHDYHFFSDEKNATLYYHDSGAMHDKKNLPSTPNQKLVNLQDLFCTLTDTKLISVESLLRSIGTVSELVNFETYDYHRLEALKFMNFNAALFFKKIGDDYFVGHSNGLHVYSRKGTKFNHRIMLPGIPVSGVILDDMGGLLVGTLNDGIYHFPAYSIHLKSYSELESVTTINKIGEDYFVGLNDGRVFKKVKDHFELFTNCFFPKENLPRINHIGVWKGNLVYSTGTNCVLVSKQGQLLDRFYDRTYCRFTRSVNNNDTLTVSTSFGLVLFKEIDGKLEKIGVLGKSELGRIQDVYYTNNGLMVASQVGLFKTYKDSIFPLFPEIFEGRGANSIELKGSHILIASRDRGVALFANGKLVKWISMADGLLSNNVHKVAFSGPNRLFIVSEIGSQELQITSDYEVIENRVIFDFRGYLGGKEIAQIEQDEDCLYINCMGNLKKVLKKKIPTIDQLKIYKTSLFFGPDQLKFESGASVPFNQNSIHISVDAVNFSKYTTRYFYQINNEEWRSNSNGQIDFQSLSDGEYTIQVYATSKFFKPSKVLRYNFTVLPPWYRSNWFLSLVIVLSILLTSLLIRWRAKLQEARRTELLTMELGALQAQMNPHFTFNTLNSIQNFILKNDIRSSIKYLSEFSMLIRQILDYAQIQLITIDEEVSFLNSYIALEKQRLKDGFQEKITVDPSLPRNAGIPSMLIQPFVENAIWHGLSHLKEGGLLTLHFERLNERLIVTISDNGKGRKFAKKRMVKDSKHKSKGMSITQNRIRIIERLYKAKIEFSIFDMDESEETGTIVRIDLPLLYTDN
jgi:hypothetical protein